MNQQLVDCLLLFFANILRNKANGIIKVIKKKDVEGKNSVLISIQKNLFYILRINVFLFSKDSLCILKPSTMDTCNR